MRDKMYYFFPTGLILLAVNPCFGEKLYGSSSSSDVDLTKQITNVKVEGHAINDPGMDATSKACRYDAPEWSDCDTFELIRFRVLRLIQGGSQCEEVKNMTRHCTPHNFPFGTHWLIQEHRKCIAELNRLKTMISDLHKFMEVIHGKGKELFDAYMKLKVKLRDLKEALNKLKIDYEHKQDILEKLKKEIDDWKIKARELRIQLDELSAKYHDLQSVEHELKIKNSQMERDTRTVKKENEGIKGKIDTITHENEELNRRIKESERNKEQVREQFTERGKHEAKLEKAQDKLQVVKDVLADCRLTNLAKQAELSPALGDEIDTKDTHVDLKMEMFIVHNKTKLFTPTMKTIYFTTKSPPITPKSKSQAKCLISYYGVTNETCWYEAEGHTSEDSYVDAFGHHLVEADWKYFTIDVNDQYECDKAAHLHYHYLLRRCSPKHFLPVLSMFRPNAEAEVLGTHIYPKVQPTGDRNTCWITFLGAHGHCEAHDQNFNLYNTDDTDEGYAIGSGNDRESCLARQEWWNNYCKTPCIATYIPTGESTNWKMVWIMHDSHGGRMFEENEGAQDVINPDSLHPNSAQSIPYPSKFHSEMPLTPDYHDSPEYRKSLNLEGKEKEKVLAQLRKRLGMTGPAIQVSSGVLQHGGVDTGTEVEEVGVPDENAESKFNVPMDGTPYIKDEAHDASDAIDMSTGGVSVHEGDSSPGTAADTGTITVQNGDVASSDTVLVSGEKSADRSGSDANENTSSDATAIGSSDVSASSDARASASASASATADARESASASASASADASSDAIMITDVNGDVSDSTDASASINSDTNASARLDASVSSDTSAGASSDASASSDINASASSDAIIPIVDNLPIVNSDEGATNSAATITNNDATASADASSSADSRSSFDASSSFDADANASPDASSRTGTPFTIDRKSIESSDSNTRAVASPDSNVGGMTSSDSSAGAMESPDSSLGAMASSDLSAGAIALSDSNAGAVASSASNAGAMPLSDSNAGAMALSDSNAGAMASSASNAGAMALSDSNAGTMTSSDLSAGAMASSDSNARIMASSDSSASAMASSDSSASAMASSDSNAGVMASSDSTSEAMVSSDSTTEAMTSSDSTSEAMASSDSSAGEMASSDSNAGAVTSLDASASPSTSPVYDYQVPYFFR